MKRIFTQHAGRTIRGIWLRPAGDGWFATDEITGRTDFAPTALAAFRLVA